MNFRYNTIKVTEAFFFFGQSRVKWAAGLKIVVQNLGARIAKKRPHAKGAMGYMLKGLHR